MVQIASVVEEAVGIETVRVGPEIRISVDCPHVHDYHRVFGDVEAGWKRSNFCKSRVCCKISVPALFSLHSQQVKIIF